MHSVRATFLLSLFWTTTLSSGAPTLSEDDVDRALEAIWLKVPAESQRAPESAKRAALETYLRQLGEHGGLFNEPKKVLSVAEFPALKFHAETLSGGIGYVRLGAFAPELSSRFEAALRDFKQLNTTILILDLRATPAQGNLDMAVELAGYLLPENTPVCEWHTAKQAAQPVFTERPPVGQFQLFLLTGPRTAGPVEAFAAALRGHGKALIFGCRTAGQAADYESIPLQDGRFLRLPVRDAVFPQEPRLFPEGLRPDLEIKVSNEATDAALSLAAQEGRIASVLDEVEFPHLNEAALVADKNPEAEAWIDRQLKRRRPPIAPTKDQALLQVLDFLTAREVLRGERPVALP